MKTEDRWIIPVDLSSLDMNGLPIIGNSHISSILSTLETKPPNPEESPLITLGSLQTEYKHSIDPISQLNRETYSFDQSIKNIKKIKKVKPKTQYYIFCNFCPFLCLNNKRINEHLATVHGNNKIPALVPEYRCPACPNTLSHLSSLDSHLLHDHYVTNKSERKIIVHLIEQSKKYTTYTPKSVQKKLDNVKQTIVTDGYLDRKEEFDEVLHDDSYDLTNDRTATLLLTAQLPVPTPTVTNSDNIDVNSHMITLPTIDLSTTHAEQMINHSLMHEHVQIRDDHDIAQNVKVFLDSPSVCPEVCKKPEFDIDIDADDDDDDDDDNCIVPEKGKINDKVRDSSYKCIKSLCNIRMRSISKLHYHQKCHGSSIELNSFTSPECAMEFSQWKPLTSHLWRLHRIDMELYSCNQCDYRTFSLGKLNNTHKLIHGDIRNYICSVCNRAFKNIKQLRNHKVLHKRDSDSADLSKFTCDECGKIFAEKRKMKLHKDSVHMKLKPFLCSYCGYKGATRSALKLHSRQHTGEKPFTCAQCDFASADHNSLRRHKLRHTGKRPYQCIHCNYSCIQSNTYKVHLKTKHPGLEKDLLFACDDCSFRSVNKDIYLSHLQTTHGV